MINLQLNLKDARTLQTIYSNSLRVIKDSTNNSKLDLRNEMAVSR